MDVTSALRAAHDLSLAAWFGGGYMGAVALDAATVEVDDHTQRIRVANAAWFRWAPIVGVSVCVEVGSAFVLGRLSLTPDGTNRRAGGVTTARTATTAVAGLATLMTGIWGRRVVRAGDVPVASAVKPISSTPVEVAEAQRRLRVAQWLVPAFTGTLIVLNALQDRVR